MEKTLEKDEKAGLKHAADDLTEDLETAFDEPSVPPAPFICVENYNFFYGSAQTLHDVTFDMPERQVTAIIGPSGCGKSTLLRNINRMNDLVDGTSHTGDIKIRNQSIYDPNFEVTEIRKRIGMVFQKSNPFPKSIYENVVYSLRVAGQKNKSLLDEAAEASLKPPPCGMRSRIVSTKALSGFPGDRCSGFVLQGPSPTARKFF